MHSSLDHPWTGKSISIALAFALRACVRAKLCARMISQWLGVVGCELSGGPAGPRSSCLSGQLTFVRVNSC